MEALSRVERQVLVHCRRVVKWLQAPINGESLILGASDRFGVCRDEAECACEALERRGFLVRDSRGLRVGDSFAQFACTVDHEVSRAEFDEALVASDQSAAYAEFCRRVHGTAFVQFNMVDQKQMHELLRLLHLTPSDYVVDVGCGVGNQAEYISDQTGARVLGLDFSRRALERATARTVQKRNRLEFRAGDLDALELPVSKFTVATSFDTLYFAEELETTVRAILASLKPGGRFAAFYSELRRPPDTDDVLDPRGTRLARALTNLSCEFDWVEFTTQEHLLWKRHLEVTLSLKPAFEAEGNAKLAQDMAKESASVLKACEEGRARRYLYLAYSRSPEFLASRLMPPT